MSFNNDKTYHEKWDTMENNLALKKLDNKFFDRSICSPHCPLGWAVEVLEMLEHIDQRFGIKRNEQTIRARFVKESLFTLFVVATFNTVSYALKTKTDWKKTKQYSLTDRVLKAKEEATRTLTFAVKVFNMRYVNPIINRVLKPKIELSQIKEKYGRLTLYFDCPPEYKKYIDNLLQETVKKLTDKGAYHPA